jgi:glutamate formiminotransferase / 5-formyltetrahydrofolate cyclo-ligase
MTPTKPLLAVPNISEGRDKAVIDAVAQAFKVSGTARLLDVHSDPDHHRSVFTLVGAQGELAHVLVAGARATIERVDVGEGRNLGSIGAHPHVGAVDVIPVVYLDTAQRGAACAEALVLAHEVGEGLGVPVFLYGELAQGRTRAELRRGGMRSLAERLSAGDVRPDFGPPQLHPTAGAALVAAREPLVAFNLELAPPATLEDAKRIAGAIREGGSEGLPGVRAIGVPLGDIRRADEDVDGREGAGNGDEDVESHERVPRARTRAYAQGTPLRNTTPQVSTNVERPLEVPLRTVVGAVREHGEIARVELVGLAPRAALEGLPEDLAFVGGDPMAHTIENALGF